eukprot:scaffold225_cov388-Prasinococcus_capsulatus_cf.AAC.47
MPTCRPPLGPTVNGQGKRRWDRRRSYRYLGEGGVQGAAGAVCRRDTACAAGRCFVGDHCQVASWLPREDSRRFHSRGPCGEGE